MEEIGITLTVKSNVLVVQSVRETLLLRYLYYITVLSINTPRFHSNLRHTG